MFGIRKRAQEKTREISPGNQDVAKLFFDAFSTKLGSFESRLKDLAFDVKALKTSGDQSKLSDLILLERLQKAEKILGESLNWIRQVADSILRVPSVSPATNPEVRDASEPAGSNLQLLMNRHSLRTDPLVVQPGSLNSVTTPTELQVLTFLADEGAKSAPEIGRLIGRSREHTARLMKKLFDEGYVRRDQTRIPFRYSPVERVKQSFTRSEEKDREQETVSASQA